MGFVLFTKDEIIMGYSLAEGFSSSGLNKSLAVIDRPPPARDQIRRSRRAKSVRLQDVARAAGVSIATVSMVVNNNARISAPTVKLVRRFIEQMGYRPAGAAANAAPARKQPTLAVLLPAQRNAFADAYFGELISGITDAATRLGHAIVFEQATPDFIRSRQHINLLEQKEADGLLCLGFNDFHGFLDDFSAEPSRAVVLVDSHVTRAKVDLVGCDYRSGAQQALNYLLQLGHRRIGLITSATGGRCTRDVAEIYQAMMSEHGIRPGDGWIADGRFSEEGGDEAAERILRRHTDVTAIFAASDKMAIGALHAAQRRGMSVPKDLSIVGFDNLPHSAFLNPPLTTVHLPLLAVGAAACERLIERIAAGRTETVCEKLATHLAVRASCAIARDLPAATKGSSAA
jgi:LacI family transcriptional regulator